MTVIETPLRSAIFEALELLGSPDAAHIAQARAVLERAVTRVPRVLPQPYRDDVARDDGVAAAFAHAEDPNAVYFRVDPETGETDDQPVALNHGDDRTDTDGIRLGYL